MARPGDTPFVLCQKRDGYDRQVTEYIKALKEAAPGIGDHGMSADEFWESGLFYSAVERLRGSNAASMKEKRAFIESALNRLQLARAIEQWTFTGSGERHDYEVIMPGGWRSIIETKGCLDGNNTNIFERPPHADEFIIWSLCQNRGSDPRKNARSGICTRLGAEVIHRGQRVDGLIIWDMVCATAGRPCPKTLADPDRLVKLSDRFQAPPPCLYLFPRNIPDARNNPAPPCWRLEEVRLMNAMAAVFGCGANDVVDVHIEARMMSAETQRRTRLVREDHEFFVSEWTTLKRARR
ncbi:MAG: hypothetical protein GC154_14600 [bacterium]|nr:hypothetical protein [bacterium]